MERFLIDECLSPALAAHAQSRRLDATHVRFLGKAGTLDYNLVDLILDGSYVFVTNNARDFLRIFSRLELHNGLILILPKARLNDQITLFEAALDFVATLDHTMNRVIEVHTVDDIRLSNLPPGGE